MQRAFRLLLILICTVPYLCEGDDYALPAVPNTSFGTPQASAVTSGHHHHHYANAMASAQQFNLAIQNAFQNPFDPNARASVDRAVNALNGSMAAVRNDVNSGQVSAADLSGMQQGLAGALESSSLKQATEALLNAAQTNAAAAEWLANAPDAGVTNSVPAADAQPALVSEEVINLQSPDAVAKERANGSTVPAAVPAPGAQKNADPSSASGTAGGFNFDLPFGFASSLFHPDNTAPAQARNDQEAGDSEQKVQGVKPVDPLDDADDAAPNPRRSIDSSDESEPPLFEADNPVAHAAPVSKQKTKSTLTAKKAIRSHRGAGLTRMGSLVPSLFSNEKESNDLAEMTFMEKVFAWSRVALLGFIFSMPLFVLFYLMGTTAARRKKAP